MCDVVATGEGPQGAGAVEPAVQTSAPVPSERARSGTPVRQSVRAEQGVRALQAASWKTRPSAWRRPEWTVLTPCRIAPADQPRLVAIGRSRVVKISPWP